MSGKKIILYNFDEKNNILFHSDCKTIREEVNLEIKPLPEWGQLKNLITSFQFFNWFWCSSKISKPVCVYVGASPGNHLYVLCQAFPDFKYYLYDIKECDSRLKNLDNVHFFQKLFDDSDIEKWAKYQEKNKNVFMIFDNRNSKYQKDMSETEKNSILIEDLRFQQKCLTKIFPVKSLLRVKFPSSFEPDPEKSEDKIHFSFFDGIVCRHTYSDNKSRDFSLIPYDNVSTRLWNVPLLENVIYYHNTINKHQYYLYENYDFPDKLFISKELGITTRYDGMIFFITIKEYLMKFLPFCNSHRLPSINEIVKCLGKIICSISPDGKNRLLPKKRSLQ